MYRCEICYDVSPPGQPLLRHVVYRPQKKSPWNPNPGLEVEREVAVCTECLHDLKKEYLSDLIVAHTFTRVARIERVRQRKAKRKREENEQLRQAREPLFRRSVITEANGETKKEPVLMEQPVTVSPARVLGRSVGRRGK